MKKKRKHAKKRLSGLEIRSSDEVAVICSDTHLSGEPAWVRRPSIRGDDLHSFEFIVDWAIEHEAPWLIIAGDVFDKRRPDSKAIEFICRQFDKLQAERVKVSYVQGQHDLSDPPWPAVHRWVKHVHGHSFSVGDHKAFGLDWQLRADLQHSLANEVPADATILVTHQVWEDFMGSYCPCEGAFNDVPGSIKLLITGDYHHPIQSTYHNYDGDEMLVVSPGSTHMRAIDEPSHKSMVVLKNDLTTYRVTIPTRPFINSTEITTDEELQDFIGHLDQLLELAESEYQADKLPEGLRTPLLRVTYNSEVENAFNRLKAAVDGRAHLFPNELGWEEDEAKVVAREARRKVRDQGLLGCLPLAVDPEEEPVLYGDLERLVQAEDVRVELQKMKTEALDSDADT